MSNLATAAAVLLSTAMLTVHVEAGEVWPTPTWLRATPEQMGMDRAKLKRARDYALTGGGSGFIIRRGRLVMQWGDPARRYDLKSTTKSFGGTALGLALMDGKIKSLNDPARRYHPSLGDPPADAVRAGWLEKITIFHLATQTAGFEKPGGTNKLLFAPGTKWSYSDSGPNWLAECITLAYRQDVNTLMFERVFTPLGIKPSDLTWRRNAYRPDKIDGIKRREFGSGIHANVDAMARIGCLYLRGGRWQDRQIIPRSFVDAARTTPAAIRGLPVVQPESYFNASGHYGLLWWNNSDGTLRDVPKDAYWSWGLYDSLIVVIPSLDVVASRAGRSLNKQGNSDYKALAPFLEPIAQSVRGAPKQSRAPYPPSPVITRLTWAPSSTIFRKAKGSDNWPTTWADDGRLYTAYGDGWGFEPKLREKLSLGFARVTGAADNFRGVNIRSATGEQKGGGKSGKKASGMLMIDGVLYMWVRNAGNSQLAWSRDHAKTWTWSDWKFTTSFGAPTFLNFGKNYDGARDDYVYTYSFDSPSAYAPADRMVLARVPKDKITRRDAYEFFKRLDANGAPVWTKEIKQRGAVFVHPACCYRSGVSYNAGLKRYLWCQIVPGGDTRFKGGLGIYDAAQPWGPWTAVFFTEQWDVGPGETASFPTKWISPNGRTCYMVFSGDDCFSVRKATLTVAGGND